MALNVGPDFKQRWLNVPDSVRQAFIDDLSRVCDVLKPETGLHSWIEQDQRAQAVSTQRIEQAYADLKAQLIEEARIRKQQALEKSLADKRAAQEAYAESLKKDEILIIIPICYLAGAEYTTERPIITPHYFQECKDVHCMTLY